MELTRYDIGAEIISILTKGMYRDPRDAVREYIQNAVDAQSKNIEVKVRTNSIVIQDYGIGMNYDILRRAVRLGISDKNPTKNVGFMGIGIYSAFHLCERLDIYSMGSQGNPNKLTMDFSKMRMVLERQKELRLSGKIDSNQLVDLQSLLEECIDITKDGELSQSVYSKTGTRVEIMGLDTTFSPVLSDFDELASYLRDVIPLRFDRENFVHAAEIEEEIGKICAKHEANFEMTNLNLQVGSRQEDLFRPYKDTDFNAKVKPQKPTIIEIKRGNMFFGVAWGCLNEVRKVVDTRSLSGFILKKQGFSVGTRDSLVKYFPKGHSYYDRTIGEVIVTNPNLLPNASRTDLEVSEYRTKFFDALQNVAAQFDEKAEQHQEWTKTDEDLAKITDELKKLNVQFERTGDDSDELIAVLVDVKAQADKISKRIKRRSSIRPESYSIATQIKDQAIKLEKSIQEKINNIINHRKTSKADKAKTIKIGKELTALHLPKPEEKKYETIFDLLEDLDIVLKDEKIKVFVEVLDEKFVQPAPETRAGYYQLLNNLKAEIQSRIESI